MRYLFLPLVCLALGCRLPAQKEDREQRGEAGFVSLFDGKSLAGWKGRGELWSLREGSIVGSSRPQGLGFNTFLLSDREYGDFILKLRFKFTGGNSGIQFRSRQIGEPAKHVVSGYQADIGDGYYGALYDEERRNRILAKPADGVVEKAYRKDDWNDYEIRAVGRKIELLMNGITTAAYEESDPSIATRGILALQIHSGGPMEVLFRDLRIREVPPATASR